MFYFLLAIFANFYRVYIDYNIAASSEYNERTFCNRNRLGFNNLSNALIKYDFLSFICYKSYLQMLFEKIR